MLTPCVICGHLITEQHHLIPRAYGGSDDPSNLVALCPNHHSAFHIALRQYEWEYRRRGYRETFNRDLPRLSEAHGTAYQLIAQDAALLRFFRDVFMPRFAAVGNPFYVVQQRRTYALLNELI